MNELIYTIFGSTGDLAYRKLMPAFYNLYSRGLVDEKVLFLAIGRRDWDKKRYLEEIKPWVKEHARAEFTEEKFAAFSEHIDYYEMQFTDINDFNGLFNYYNNVPWTGSDNSMFIFYLAVAPSFYETISKNLALTGCLKGTSRVIIEKPFGTDLEDAKETTKTLESNFGTGNVYHIDHYLGKEMVQNLLSLRLYNPIFASIWNNKYIDSVQINALESIDIGDRGAYYDENGAIKDMVQTHLFQVLSFLAVDLSTDDDRKDFRQAQEKLFLDLRAAEDDVTKQLVLGQYKGYQDTAEVAEDSQTETFAAVKVYLDNEQWQGVPFYLRSGKALEEKATYVSIIFKQDSAKLDNNVLVIKIDPEDEINLHFVLSKPGPHQEQEAACMRFKRSEDAASFEQTPDAYERLLYAAYKGEVENFATWEQIEASWNFMNSLRAKAKEQGLKPELYEKGSKGPKSQDRILENDDDIWY